MSARAIIRSQNRIIGVTTEASLWVVASVGMAVSIGFYFAVIVVTALSYLTLRIKWVEERLHKDCNARELKGDNSMR